MRTQVKTGITKLLPGITFTKSSKSQIKKQKSLKVA